VCLLCHFQMWRKSTLLTAYSLLTRGMCIVLPTDLLPLQPINYTRSACAF